MATTPRLSLQDAKNVRRADIHDGIVVYIAGRTIHLLRLRDGSQAAIVVPGGEVRAQLEAPGLFYSYRAPTARAAPLSSASPN